MKSLKIHRLVAYMFIENDDKNKNIVNHKDENKENNCINNLEWCTQRYNCNYGTRTQRVINKRKKYIIRMENKGNIKLYYGTDEAEKDGFDRSKIVAVCKGNRKKHKGYEWYYVEDYILKFKQYKGE